MENASKALIIAGAILISIVLIGVGVLIVGNAQGIFGQGSTQMSQMEIQAFNEPFMAFEGKQSGSNVRSLIQKIGTHNTTYADDDEKQIKLTITATGYKGETAVTEQKISMNDVSVIKSGIGAGSSYKVVLVYHDDNSGLLEEIKIENWI